MLWRRLRCTSLSETSQSKKTKCSELYEILKKETVKRSVVARGGVGKTAQRMYRL